jgi:hypothetical protein
MRGMNGKLWAVGALASAALMFTGCKKSESDEPLPSATPRIQISQGRYGPIGAYPSGRSVDDLTAAEQEELGTGGSGPAAKGHKGGHGGMHTDGGMPMDAGMGGSGLEGSDTLGTSGDGVTGGDTPEKTNDSSGFSGSGGVPAPSGGQ